MGSHIRVGACKYVFMVNDMRVDVVVANNVHHGS